jgi:hypothetical protein
VAVSKGGLQHRFVIPDTNRDTSGRPAPTRSRRAAGRSPSAPAQHILFSVTRDLNAGLSGSQRRRPFPHMSRVVPGVL